jgi:hypothetical protein
MKKVTVVLVTALILSYSTVGFAQGSGRIVMEDAFYGTITGALVGAAFMAFEDKPEDHWGYIYRGAAIGAIAGLLFGAYEVTAFATIDNGKIRFAMPTIKTRVVGNIEKDVQTSVDILEISF